MAVDCSFFPSFISARKKSHGTTLTGGSGVIIDRVIVFSRFRIKTFSFDLSFGFEFPPSHIRVCLLSLSMHLCALARTKKSHHHLHVLVCVVRSVDTKEGFSLLFSLGTRIHRGKECHVCSRKGEGRKRALKKSLGATPGILLPFPLFR